MCAVAKRNYPDERWTADSCSPLVSADEREPPRIDLCQVSFPPPDYRSPWTISRTHKSRHSNAWFLFAVPVSCRQSVAIWDLQKNDKLLLNCFCLYNSRTTSLKISLISCTGRCRKIHQSWIIWFCVVILGTKSADRRVTLLKWIQILSVTG